MAFHLTDNQRRLAHHVLLFDRPLSYEVAEALQRGTLGCAENKITRTGITEFFCGLYLQFRDHLQVHFSGDIGAVVGRIFPKHRFGDKGLVAETVLENAASDKDSTGFGYNISLSDELIRLLWTATRLANAVGRKTSLKDVVAAVALDDHWLGELRSNGISPRQEFYDFKDVLNVVFYASIHAHGSSKEMQFELDEKIEGPYDVLLRTPSGGFAPMKTARLTLNDRQIAAISWPDRPQVRVSVELQQKNKLNVEFDGPQFGSMDVTVRGATRKQSEIAGN